jgi:hypothetical protein
MDLEYGNDEYFEFKRLNKHHAALTEIYTF